MRLARVAIVMLVFASVLSAFPQVVEASNLILPSGGMVSVEFVFTEALYINDVKVVKPFTEFLFNTKTTRLGTTVFLGSYPAGTEFEFELVAKTPDPTVTYTWSSNPHKNTDGQDHVKTTSLDPKTFKMAWEDMPIPPGGDFNDAVNDAVMVVRIDGDEDGDGLWDLWETNGVDVDADGTIDLPIHQAANTPDGAADPKHKDIFLEIDWMEDATHSHKPKQAAIDLVKAAFADAPAALVSNPDGKKGITLHVDVSNAVPHTTFISFDSVASYVVDFDDIKAAHFDSNRRSVYHYCVFAHCYDVQGFVGGMAEYPGNDFIITFGEQLLGTPDEHVGTLWGQATGVMHELGHNLGLHHGGWDEVNYKPNYLSIMNYHFVHEGIPSGGFPPSPTTWRIDYSREKLPSLKEDSLDEGLGIQDGVDRTMFYDPQGILRGFKEKVYGSGFIDWNWNNVGEGVTYKTANVAVNINNDYHPPAPYPPVWEPYYPQLWSKPPPSGWKAEFGVLEGYNDWANLKYIFTDTEDFEDFLHNSPNHGELDLDTAARIAHPPPPVSVDIKPGSWPNPLKLKSRGVLPVTVCGSEDFDVSTIDPDTILLNLEGVSVEPIRWSYEDVATPFTGEICSGHDLGADGYLDLTVKFKTVEVLGTLGLDDHVGHTIILVLTGKLKEVGTSIHGEDYIVILDP